uniref:Uncharacterized protein LOC114344465 n=1 Tax=Diabrotica virgifera virgifera TaxID=50390 RepID=A0A6P7GMG3_DIAVI
MITEQVPTLVLDNIIDKLLENCLPEVKEHRKNVVMDRNNNNTSSNSDGKEEKYTWKCLIDALNCAEEDNDWQDDQWFCDNWFINDIDTFSSDESLNLI